MAPTRTRHTFPWVACLACGALSFPARSADPPGEPSLVAQAPSSTGSERLDRIVVTGEKRTSASAGVLGDRKLIDTPLSITVLPREVLDLQQASFYGDYLKNEPAATLGNVPVGFTTLRGFQVGIDGYLYDGLVGAQGLSDGRNQIEGVDRIEVLKGPSAVLNGISGASSVGGLINYVPKRPGDTPVRSATLNASNRSLYGATADVGDRFGPDRAFGYRVNVGYKNGETPVERYDWRHRAATAAFDWRVVPGLVLSANVEYARNAFPRLQPFYVLAPGVSVPRAPDARKSLAQPWDDFSTTSSVAYLRADWSFADDWSLTAQALSGRSYRKRIDEARFGFIESETGELLLFGSRDQSRNDGVSGQLVVNGRAATGALGHQLSFGAGATRTQSAFGSSGQGVYPTSLYAPTSYAQPDDVDVHVGRSQRIPTSSVFATDIVSFTPAWSVLAGVRHSRVTVDNFDVLSDAQLSRTRTVKNSPLGAVFWKPRADTLVYANVAKGVEQGGTAPAGTANANQVLPAVQTRQVEVGAKLDTGAVLYSAAAFDIRRPVETVDPATFVFAQGGEQRHRGVEFQVYGRVRPDLLVVAGAMFLDATARDGRNPAFDGKRPVGVANRTGNLFVDYRIGDLLPGWFINGGVYAVGPQYLDGANTQRVAGYARLDAGVRYETRVGGAKTSLLVNVENLANRSYWAGAQIGILTVNDPLTVKATLRADF